MGRRYSYTVRVDGLLPDGQVITRDIQVTTNREDLNPGDIKAAAQEAIDIDPDRYAFDVTGMTVTGGVRTPS